jgi:thiamine-monophosphate kinase
MADLTEFELIARAFMRPVPAGVTGGGDDCALFEVPTGMRLATSNDLLLEGRHFFSDVDPQALGHKALAVNLSDLAAMGARPLACLLGLGLPHIDVPWVDRFAEGFYALADRHACPLVGGDTTRSLHDITLSVTVFGFVDPDKVLRRDAARAGDDIWVSGQLGAADVACRMLAGTLPVDAQVLAQTRMALERPEPRIALGLALAGLAHAAIDVSDGLLQDLGHVLKASGVGAQIDETTLPLHPALAALPETVARQAALAGGDLYELCFTADPADAAAVTRAARAAGALVTRIGRVLVDPGLRVFDRSGAPLPALPTGFDHFR